MTILLIFPHPDDEALFCGGVITRHVLAGDEVVLACASYGERGGHAEKRSSKLFYFLYYLLGLLRLSAFLQKVTVKTLSVIKSGSGKLAATRKKEAQRAAELLGLRKIVFWGIPDMRFDRQEQKIKKAVRKSITQYRPSVIYTLHANGLTGHPDHITLSKCVADVVADISYKSRPGLLRATVPGSLVRKYNLPLTGVSDKEIQKHVILTSTELKRKVEAINSYRSQTYLWSGFLERYPEVLQQEYFA